MRKSACGRRWRDNEGGIQSHVSRGLRSSSLESYPCSQGEPLTLHVWFRVPLPEILWMHPALNPDTYTILTNQAEPSRQAGAFGATKLKALSDFLDGESVYHSLMLPMPA